jgi:hypothetical protein
MKRSQFLILLAILAVLVVAGAGVTWWQRGQWRGSDTRVGQPLAPGLVVANVSAISLRQPGASVTLQVKNDQWQVAERGGYPASVDRIGEFLAKVAGLKIVQVEPLAESQRARLQLLEPEGPDAKDGGTSVELKDKDGKQRARLLLGKKVVRQSATTAPSKGSPDPSGRYVTTGEAGSVMVVSDPLALAEAKPELWLARDLIRVHGARQLTSIGPDGRQRWSVIRESESADWKSTVPGDKLDSNKVQDLVSVLIYIALADVATDAPDAGFNRNPTLKVSTFNNFNYTLSFGDQKGDSRYLRISLDGNPPEKRVPAKDESAEDKAKKDKEYEENHKGMLMQLEREKRLEGWTFLVKSSDVESLLRDRAQLAPQKKDDKKAAK